MHPTTMLMLAYSGIEERELGLERRRLAAEARFEHGRSRRGSGRSAPAWRRSIGWALIHAGVRRAGGAIPAGAEQARAGAPGR